MQSIAEATVVAANRISSTFEIFLHVLIKNITWKFSFLFTENIRILYIV